MAMTQLWLLSTHGTLGQTRSLSRTRRPTSQNDHSLVQNSNSALEENSAKIGPEKTSLVHPTLKRSVALVDRRSVSQVHPRKPVLMQVPNPRVATAAAHHTEHDTVGIVSTSIAPLSRAGITDENEIGFQYALCVRLFSFPRPHAEAYHP
ncbi:hypothetical protein GE21DRAFT_1283059 [Neurospora crassa]|nr:hypothetical protein GE21DRAFT_1283059 [Neurospora crassa]